MNQPQWPMPEGWVKPKISVNGDGTFLVEGPYGADHDTLEDALREARDMNCAESYRSEYTQRREALARFLHDLVYGDGAWGDNSWGSKSDLHLNYRLDADDILKANPHLLTLGERERLEDEIPELRYP